MDDIEFSAFSGLFIPYRLHMILAGRADDWMSEYISIAEENTFVHETIHWWQTSMTGYGHSTWSLFRQATSFLIREWVDATSDTPNARPLPLGPLDLSAAGPQTPRSALRFEVARLSALETLSSAQARFALPQPKARVSQISKRPDANVLDWSVNPIINLKDGEYVLQGCDIVESQAHYLATQFLQNQHGISEIQLIPAGLSPKYWAAYVWFIREVGPERAHLFSMICDFSLQTVWAAMPTNHVEWKRQSPAWRFVELTAILAERDVPILPMDRVTTDYATYADDLLRKAKMPSLAEVFSAAFRRGEWRKPLLHLERRMLEAMEFKQLHPWCGAYPWFHAETKDALLNSFPPPLVQIEGRLSFIRPKIKASQGDYSDISGESGNEATIEIGAEFLLQGIYLQILGFEPPKRTPVKGALECGFTYFGVAQVCPHQIADNCPGWFFPRDGSPFPIVNFGSESELGCPLEKLLSMYNVAVEDIKIVSN